MDNPFISLAAGFAVAVALGVVGLLLNRRSGLDPWQRELSTTRGAVIEALQAQVKALESRAQQDREHFEQELASKDHRIALLEEEVRRLERVVDKLTGTRDA